MSRPQPDDPGVQNHKDDEIGLASPIHLLLAGIIALAAVLLFTVVQALSR